MKEPSCFMLNEKGVFLSAHAGRVNEAVISFDQAGIYRFYCPSQKFRGKVHVLEDPETKWRKKVAKELKIEGKEQKRTRSPASQTRVLWRPKEF